MKRMQLGDTSSKENLFRFVKPALNEVDFVEYFVRFFPRVRSDSSLRCLDLSANCSNVYSSMSRRFPQMEFLDFRDELRQEEGPVKKLDFSLGFKGSPYDVILSNGLLHKVSDRGVFWSCIKSNAESQTRIFAMDFLRAETFEIARSKAELFCKSNDDLDESQVYNSLISAFSIGEIVDMIRKEGLHGLRAEAVSSTHLVIQGYL